MGWAGTRLTRVPAMYKIRTSPLHPLGNERVGEHDRSDPAGAGNDLMGNRCEHPIAVERAVEDPNPDLFADGLVVPADSSMRRKDDDFLHYHRSCCYRQPFHMEDRRHEERHALGERAQLL